jgi:hypothetical protein
LRPFRAICRWRRAPSPAALADHRDGLEVEGRERLAERQAGFGKMAFDAAAAALRHLVLGKRGEEARRGLLFLVGLLGEQQFEPRGVDRSGRLHAWAFRAQGGGFRHVNDGEFVIGRQWRQGDGNVRDGGAIRLEALAQSIKLRQFAEIEYSLDRIGEFGLAGAVMGERLQAEHGAAACLSPSPVTAPDHFVDEAPVGGEVGEVARAAQQKLVAHHLLEVTVRATDDELLPLVFDLSSHACWPADCRISLVISSG